MSRLQLARTTRPGSVSRALARDRLGVPAVLFFVLAGVAPLTVAAGVIPTAYQTTGLTAIPAAFLAVAVILAVFSVGYVAMTRHITNSGAFYAFISRGISRPAGVAAALVALVAYTCLQVGLYGALGPAASAEAATHLGVHASWWAWALAAWAVVTVLGQLRVDITGWVLGVLLTAEITVTAAETICGLATPAGGQLSFATLSPAGLARGGFGAFGVLAVVSVLGFVGFEQAPVLAEEARNPQRTVPAATYGALGMIAVVYAGASWAMAVHAGNDHVVTAAGRQGPGLLFGLGGGTLGQVAQFLFMTSLFAAALAFHNVVWRYMYALGRENVLPAALGRTGSNNIPKTASLAQSATGLATILAYAALGWNPMTRLFFWLARDRRLRNPGAAHPDLRGGDRLLRPQPAPGEPVAPANCTCPGRRPAGRNRHARPAALRHPARRPARRPRRMGPARQLRRGGRDRAGLGADPEDPPARRVRSDRARRPRRHRPAHPSRPGTTTVTRDPSQAGHRAPPGPGQASAPASQQDGTGPVNGTGGADAAPPTTTAPPGIQAATDWPYPSGVVRAGPADLDTLSQVIAAAFHELPPSRWLIPGPTARRQIFPGYFRLHVEHALADGTVHTTADRAAAALWMPVCEHPAGQPAGYGPRLRAATSPWTSRFLALDAALDQHHPAGIPHYHLALLAVRPGCQGQGTGTALLHAFHQILDHTGTPAYLEAADLRTRGIYLRRGYADHGRPIRLPDGPLMYPMMREPPTQPRQLRGSLGEGASDA